MKRLSDANCKSLGTSLPFSRCVGVIICFQKLAAVDFSTFFLIIPGKMALHKRLLYEKVRPWLGWDEEIFFMCC